MSNAWLLKPMMPASVAIFGTGAPQFGVSSNLLNDYAGVIVQVPCDTGSANEARINVDMGADVAIDTMMLFGLELFPTTGTLTVNYATAAQGNFTGAFTTEPTIPAYAGSAAMTSGKGVALWSRATPATARYWQFIFTAGAGVTGKSIRASRLVIGRRIQLERNFGYGAAFGVRDLGAVDFSRRGVLLRQRGAKLRTVGLTFSTVRKDEMEAQTKPLLEYLGNTEMVALLIDPAVDAQRQNRAYFGPLVGDLGHAWRNAAGFEVKINHVSIF